MPRSGGGRRGTRSGRGRLSPARGVELDRFSSADLRTWQRHAENLETYHVRLYFHLESLRALEHDRLCAALCNSKTVQLVLDGWVRIVDYRYSLQPLSAVGSLVHGGRFNVGADLDPLKFPTFAALYLAESYETAYEEKFGAPSSPGAALAGREFALRRPGSFTSVNVSGRLANLFDLRSAASLKAFARVIASFGMPKELKAIARSLGMTGRPLLATTPKVVRETLLARNWREYPAQYGIPANPQVFGRLLLDAGFDGVVYPSSRSPKCCISLFPGNFARSESFVEVSDKGPPNTSALRLDSSTWEEIVGAPPKPSR